MRVYGAVVVRASSTMPVRIQAFAPVLFPQKFVVGQFQIGALINTGSEFQTDPLGKNSRVSKARGPVL